MLLILFLARGQTLLIPSTGSTASSDWWWWVDPFHAVYVAHNASEALWWPFSTRVEIANYAAALHQRIGVI